MGRLNLTLGKILIIVIFVAVISGILTEIYFPVSKKLEIRNTATTLTTARLLLPLTTSTIPAVLR